MVQIGTAFNECTAGLGHFRAVYCHESVNVHTGRFTETGTFQHGRPEQAVEIRNVFTDEMIQLCVGVFVPEIVKVNVILITEILETGHVTNRRIYPHIKEFVRCARNFKTKIRCIAADIPLLQAVFKPFLKLVCHFSLNRTGADPLFQHAFKLRQVKEEVLRFL